MKHDGLLDIATGMSARSRKWKNQKMNWSDLVKKLITNHKTNETYKEFVQASKADQLKIKDVGGYVGGYLRGGKRGLSSIVHRQLITLDIDFAHMNFWSDFTLQFGNAAVLHATHKHSEVNPRLRLVMPLTREVTPDEYVAIARKVAGVMGIDLFDSTTFETVRLMFWPSSPKDVDYYSEFQDGPWLDADAILSSYMDWTDSSLWPTADREADKIRGAAKKQQDPELKKGIIGAFCRKYDIHSAIETYLPDDYSPSLIDGRYTYMKGTTAAGLVTYEDKFAFSHHGTDPTSGKLCNAFDLVRIHRFGHLDTDGKTTQSFKEMESLVLQDKEVKAVMAKEAIENAVYDFAEAPKIEESETSEAEDVDWMKELEIDSKGKFLSSAINLNLIFANDYRLKNIFKFNTFDGKRYILPSPPWRKVSKPEPMRDVDYSGVRNYIETFYSISGNFKIDDSLALEFEKNSFHPVRDYLKGLEWDGVERLDNLLIDYFGADNNIYSKEASRKMLVGAAARVFNPGCKFDLVLTLVGKEGIGKSSFANVLGGAWFSDTFMTVHGKEALEQIQGAWIIEMAELAGLRKADVESIKHFITKQVDTFRPAYARTSETYQRQCIFYATTNTKDFLKDPSGNRRFLPIDCNIEKATKEILSNQLANERDQIWAEAVRVYKSGEELFLSREAEEIARTERMIHSETDERLGLVIKYLNTPIPPNWSEMDSIARVDYLERGEYSGQLRQYVCVAEIWCECLGKDKTEMSQYNTRDLNNMLRGLSDWEPSKSTKNFNIYGKQRFYQRSLL